MGRSDDEHAGHRGVDVVARLKEESEVPLYMKKPYAA